MSETRGQLVFDDDTDGAFARETERTPLTFLRPIPVAPWEMGQEGIRPSLLAQRVTRQIGDQ